MKLSVVIPTFRRIKDLERCLDAIFKQDRLPDELIVTVRWDDPETREFLQRSAWPAPAVNVVGVPVPGVVAAMNAALVAATGEVIALTDDDAAPWPDWLARIEQHFRADPQLGGLGGRDWRYGERQWRYKGAPPTVEQPRENRPGEIQWWGRVIGDHHLALPGPPREVSVVKGVNSAFRADALRQAGGFDTRLAGTGAQVHWELGLCLAIRKAGWKVVFDPVIGVDHFPARRLDEDQRDQFDLTAESNAVHNETLILCEHLPPIRRAAFMLWAIVLGTQGALGMLQVPRLLALNQRRVLRRWLGAMRGRCSGFLAYRRHRKPVGRGLRSNKQTRPHDLYSSFTS